MHEGAAPDMRPGKPLWKSGYSISSERGIGQKVEIIELGLADPGHAGATIVGSGTIRHRKLRPLA